MAENTTEFNVMSGSLEGGKGRYAAVNGLNMYYEIHGTGKPLILLHGGLGVIGMFEQLLPALAHIRQVVAVERQGHGHTADIARPFSFEQMADDIAALIEHLGIEEADVAGYSLGGKVALQTAIRHPDVVRKLVLISTPYKREGWHSEALAGMSAVNAEAAAAMVGSPPHQAYVSVAPRPEDWVALVTKTGDLIGQDYDWSAGVKSIKAPTLVVLGDADNVRLDHAVEMFELLGGGPVILTPDGRMGSLPNSRLAVLPGTTHFDILNRADLLLPIILPFLDESTPTGS
jgi:pimeloyl-ACP methyl ester carboxylesterase